MDLSRKSEAAWTKTLEGINYIATYSFFQIREYTRNFPPFHVLK